jgi:hypothetical protein
LIDNPHEQISKNLRNERAEPTFVVRPYLGAYSRSYELNATQYRWYAWHSVMACAAVALFVAAHFVLPRLFNIHFWPRDLALYGAVVAAIAGLYAQNALACRGLLCIAIGRQMKQT